MKTSKQRYLVLATLLLIGLAACAGARAARSSMGPNLLPAIDDRLGWHLYNDGGVDFGLRELDAGEPNTWAADVTYAGDMGDGRLESTSFHLKDGKYYTLQFDARADGLHPIAILVETANSHQNVGVNQMPTLGFPYQTYSYNFVAHDAHQFPVKVVFEFGSTTGRVWIRGVSLNRTRPTASPNNGAG